MKQMLLTDGECMVALTELEDRAIGGEDIRWDKVSEVIAKAQLKAVIDNRPSSDEIKIRITDTLYGNGDVPALLEWLKDKLLIR